jgi:hypothetical protein
LAGKPILAQGENHRVLFIERSIDEVVASQRKMLLRSEANGATSTSAAICRPCVIIASYASVPLRIGHTR